MKSVLAARSAVTGFGEFGRHGASIISTMATKLGATVTLETAHRDTRVVLDCVGARRQGATVLKGR